MLRCLMLATLLAVGVMPIHSFAQQSSLDTESREVQLQIKEAELENAKYSSGLDNYVLLLNALHTGMKVSELAGLQWKDVDFRQKLLVRRQYKDGAESKTKTRKSRKVDVSDTLLKELQTLRKRR